MMTTPGFALRKRFRAARERTLPPTDRLLDALGDLAGFLGLLTWSVASLYVISLLQ